jgi:membrane protease YdiL (CAAX protease family)
MPPAAGRRRTSEFWLPMGNVLLPGLGQYAQDAPAAGLAFTATAVGGYTLAVLAPDPREELDGGFPRLFEEQVDFLGFQLGLGAGFVSSYDSFHRSLPELQARGRYRFVHSHPPTARLLDAPFELRYLKRETTLVPLALTAVMTGVLVAARRGGGGEGFRPFRVNDGLFAFGVSYNAGVSEEAFFRGYLQPLLHERLGRNHLLSNSLQALAFGLGHISEDQPVPWYPVLFGFYQGIVTTWNGGNVRESVFQHFWHNMIVISAAFLLEKEARPLQVSVTVRF